MGTSVGKIDLDSITLEQIQELYDWLQDNSCPGGIELKQSIQLSEEEAFSVIYYLQEHLGIIPDKFERCCKCGCIYDSHGEGTSICNDTTIVDRNGKEINANFPEEMYGMYCDDCRPDWIDMPYDQWIKEIN